MATSVALKRSITAITPFKNLFAPVRTVSAARRLFNTNSSQVSAYEDFNRSVDSDSSVYRRPDSSVYRRRDNDFFSDMFDPISPTRSLSQIFNMMDKFMDNPFMSASCGPGFGPRRSWDANENENTLSLRFDMPGLDKDNVKISVEHNTLIIKAEAENESENDNDEEQPPPRRYSSRIDLPTEVYKLDEIKAEMKNGVLKIMVPKVNGEEKKEVREIQVE